MTPDVAPSPTALEPQATPRLRRVLGLVYSAVKTRGFRTAPVMMDLSGA